MSLKLVQPKPRVEHKPICAIDGQPWPCAHHQAANHDRYSRYWNVLCLACGKPRNNLACLQIDDDGHGRTIYFHARKRCVPKARAWWEEHGKPRTGQPFSEVAYLGIPHLGDYLRKHGAKTFVCGDTAL